MKTLWIDMSDFTVWKGHFTGIQRVVFNIAKRYFKDEKYNTKYFYFDDNKKVFYEYDFSNFLESLTRVQNNAFSVSNSKKRILVNKTKYIYLRSNLIKKIIPPARAKILASKGKHAYLRTKNMAIKRKSIASNLNEVKFKDSDEVLILGNTWDRPNLLIELSIIKKENNLKIYQVVYDLIPTFVPQAFNEDLYNIYTKNMFEVATISDAVMCISKSTKNDFIRFCNLLNINPPKAEVIRLGDDIPTSEDPYPPVNIGEKEKFVLCVGTIEARKNHMLLYYSWKEGLLRNIRMPKLVLVGRAGWYTQDFIHSVSTDPNTMDLITILDDVSDNELVWLYQNCQFTIYPSYYEGWGLPVAESLAFGKLCLSSNVSSMPEIGGDLIDYFSPFNSSQCLEMVNKYLDKNTLLMKEKLIKNTYKKYSWDYTFKSVNTIKN